MTTIKGHNSITNKQSMTGNNPNLDLVNINAYTIFREILSTCSQYIELKQNSDVNHRSLKFGPYITYIASKPKAHGVII